MNSVKALRSQRGWSQMKLATAANVSLPTVQRAEAGTRKLTYASALKIATALEVDVADLLPESELPAAVFTNDAPRWATQQTQSIADLHAKIDRLLELCEYSPHIDNAQN